MIKQRDAQWEGKIEKADSLISSQKLVISDYEGFGFGKIEIFKDEDLEPMTQINQDPKVMEYFPALGDKEQTRIHIKRINDHYAK